MILFIVVKMYRQEYTCTSYFDMRIDIKIKGTKHFGKLLDIVLTLNDLLCSQFSYVYFVQWELNG